MDQTPRPAQGGTTPSDELLLAAYREAEGPRKRAAADQLFARYYERVGRWCYRFTGDRDSAADLAQEVFLKAHRHLESFRGTAQFGTWLYTIVRHEALNRARSSASRPLESESEEQLIQVPALEPGPEELAARSSTSRRLHQLLNATLDETERTVFTLHYGEDVPLDAITRMLRLDNSSGAKAYIVSAKRKLSRAVERWLVRGEKL
ncbi:MAG: polymerase sigma-70 factor, subfamily [Acidobacteriota bacterium]|jgi:RNA polymerase sigma-70 factor (ECF subfamily)|nr:polymerase sigma-70 factor, subfamily [Acidobacteriota bacterium]